MFPIDGSTDPYANLAAATADKAEVVGGCYVWYSPGNSVVISRTFSVTFPAGLETVSDVTVQTEISTNSSVLAVRGYYKAANGVATTYNFSWTGSNTTNSASIDLYDSTGANVDSFATAGVPSSGSHTMTVPSDGYYWLVFTGIVNISSPSGSATFTNAFTANGGTGSTNCYLNLAYLSSGSTLYLSCP